MSLLLSARGLTKTFQQKRGLFSRQTHVIRALAGVSFDVPRGATVGVVGESGSGKSTLGRCLLRLTEPDEGSVVWRSADGEAREITTLGDAALREFRRRAQVIFQDPNHSLNPARRVWEIVGEGLIIRGGVSARDIRERAAAMLVAVRLSPDHLDRWPHEFSGGQRQRLAIARALLTEPEFVVCDEVTSALDTRTAAQVLDLLRELQAQKNLTLLFISHDLHTVAAMSDEVLVMHAGRIVEQDAPQQLFAAATNPYTRQLIAALPGEHPRQRRFRRQPAGET